MLFWLLLACSGTDDSAKDSAEGDADTDTDTDTDTDSDTDADCTGGISGTILTFDGLSPAETEVQACDTFCFPTQTLADGSFSFEGLCPGSYKVDALGENERDDYGHVRVHTDLETTAVTLPLPLYIPRVYGPETVTSGRYTFGTDFGWTVDASTLSVPFGFEDDQFWAGAIPAAEIPAYWDGLDVQGAVSFRPFGTTVSAPFDIAVLGLWPESSYQAYYIDDHGLVQGPVGTLSVVEGVLMGTVEPAFLTWILIVPG